MNFLGFSFFPAQASEAAKQIDALYLYLIGVSAFFALLIYALVAFFAVRYRRRRDTERPKPIEGHNTLEILWSVIPLFIVMSFFIWGTVLYFKTYRAPANALEIFVVGKQWMWKLQHPSGPREINELHVPVNYPVKLTITSEDVIHSFYIPAFRIKMDAVPGRYTHTWFKATETGKFHLFCAEYCGTDHSQMIGWIHVMSQADYQQWISERTGKAPATQMRATDTAAVKGKELFARYRCFACHSNMSGSLGPDLSRVFGNRIRLASGQTVTADEAYIRESIKTPMAKVVEGYAPLMPTYEKLLTEEEIFAIIAFLKSQAAENQNPPTAKQPSSAQHGQ